MHTIHCNSLLKKIDALAQHVRAIDSINNPYATDEYVNALEQYLLLTNQVIDISLMKTDVAVARLSGVQQLLLSSETLTH